MKKLIASIAILAIVGSVTSPLFAATQPEPTIYVVQKGGTLWGLSERFFSDPYFWPNLWSRNQTIGNPHFIYPGQKLRILPDRIESVTNQQPPPPSAQSTGKTVTPPLPESISEKTFSVTGSEGFLTEDELTGVGRIVATNHDWVMVGAGDTVYTDIGANRDGRTGERFSIFSSQEVITHPIRQVTVGRKIIPLGTLELTAVTPTGSRAVITGSFREISSGALLLPWRNGRQEIPLKGSVTDLSGIILDSLPGIKAIGTGEVVYLDLGKSQGVQVGNLLYVVRKVRPDRAHRDTVTLPQELLGAVVIVEVRRDTATALVVKSVETIYPGDQVVTVLPQ